MLKKKKKDLEIGYKKKIQFEKCTYMNIYRSYIAKQLHCLLLLSYI